MLTVQEILREIRSLTEEDRMIVKAELISRIPRMGDDPDVSLENERFSKGYHCPHCSSVRIRRNGHSKDGRQRFLCVDCGRTFGARSKTLLAGTSKGFAVWETYLECMFSGMSLRQSAQECHISLPTAFSWRHKILDSLRQALSSLNLGGVVEADETYVNVSYKGNHSKSHDFIMPRESRHRGHELHQSGISQELVCISCAISRDGTSIASALTLGRASEKEMETFFKGRLDEGTVLCTDHEPAYRAYARLHAYRHIQLDTKETHEGFTIQRINAYHSRLKSFLSGFRGVSTKYLDNYLAWNTLRDRIRLRGAEEEAPLLWQVLTSSVNTLNRTLRQRPATPAPVV